MQQVIVIHGGTTFNNRNDYVRSLSETNVDINRLKYRPKWKELLNDRLGSDFEVLLPSMPNSSNARYEEWKIWFKNVSSLFSDNCIVIGHSLGGIFLAKYLSEHAVSFRIKATILIAAPYDDETIEDLADFKIIKLTNLMSQQAGRLIFFNGVDDPVVPLHEMHKYQKALPTAEYTVLPAPDHFVRADFPELTKLIENL
jgi:predicted alpha/beta hydrolase family esterase